MKKRITTIAEELGVPVETLLKLKDEKLSKLHCKGTGRNTWIDAAGQEILRLSLEVPEVVPSKLRGRVIGECANPRWVRCRIDGKDGAYPVLIPLKLRGKLLGKPITIDAITDINGTTYRHELLGS